MDPTQPRRIVRPTLTPRVTLPAAVGCCCCSCSSDQVDEFCRAHGGPTIRCCETHHAVGVIHMDAADVTPVSVQQKHAGIPDPDTPQRPEDQ